MAVKTSVIEKMGTGRGVLVKMQLDMLWSCI